MAILRGDGEGNMKDLAVGDCVAYVEYAGAGIVLMNRQLLMLREEEIIGIEKRNRDGR